jgi:adenosine deaminase
MKRSSFYRLLTFFIILFVPGKTLQAQTTIDDYFEKIRINEAELTAFITQMPKGGDLHNHYSGALYGETYFNWLMEANFCINPSTLEIAKPYENGTCTPYFEKISALKTSVLNDVRGRLLRLWSTKDYDQLHTDPREEHFFATFGNFGIASDMNYIKGLQELKTRAIAENVSYIETMLTRAKIQSPQKPADLLSNNDTIRFYNDLLIKLGQQEDQNRLEELLNYLYNKIMKTLPVEKSAVIYNHFIDSLYPGSSLDDKNFTMRFLTFIGRTDDPLITFINLLVCFRSVEISQLPPGSKILTGLNIVAPEDNPVSMRDYWLHMNFFKYYNKKFGGKIPYSMHAGELTEGFVKPELLTYHIDEAVYIAGARRIGHGVDIAYERKNHQLLDHMSKTKSNIPVEINLSSNEFILGVKDDRHPIMLYKKMNVPLVISTDDPGVSRSSLTEQYVLLAKRYKDISYPDIKEFVYNSIHYSFLGQEDKNRLKDDMDRRFREFEEYMLSFTN